MGVAVPPRAALRAERSTTWPGVLVPLEAEEKRLPSLCATNGSRRPST